jgi:lipid-binding SYLF domain-containing protein
VKRWKKGRLGLLAMVAALGILILSVGSSAVAGEKMDAEQLVEKSRMTLESFIADKDMGPPLKSLLPRAKGVLIYPQVLKGAFIIGASGGSGVMLAHDERGHG